MNKFYFSPTTLSFYPKELIASYESAGTLPADVIPVSDEVFNEYSGTPPDGKIRFLGNDNLPTWGDIPPPSQVELIAAAEAKKAQLRVTTDSEIGWRQDAVDANIATEEEAADLLAWKKYRVLLMRVDTSKAPDIVWPVSP